MPNILNEEKQRVNAILEAVTDMPEHQRLAASAIKSGMTVDVFKSQLLSEIRTSRNTCPPVAKAGKDPQTKDLLQCCCLLALGHEKPAIRLYGGDTVMRAKATGLLNLSDIAKRVLELDGQTGLPHGSTNILKASFSTTSFSNLLSGSIDKLMQDSTMQIPDSWRPFAKIRNLSNYRSTAVLRPNFNVGLEEVPSSGEVRHGSINETNFDAIQCGLYSKIVRLSLQQIVNDDLSAFAEMPAILVRAAKRSVADLVYSVLLANAGSHFATGNNNYFDGASSALGSTSLSTAIAMLRKQVDVNGSLLDLIPTCLLVPAALEGTAKSLLNSSELNRTGDGDPLANPWNQSLILSVEPRLELTSFTGYSTTAWFLFAQPDAGAMNVAFLQGNETPTIDSFGPDADAEVLGYTWRVSHSFGASYGDPAGCIKSKGSA